MCILYKLGNFIVRSEPISEAVRNLMRDGAKSILMSETALRDRLQDAVIDSFDTQNDPAAETAIRRYNILSVTHWASAILRDPEGVVEPFVDPAIRLQIREQIRQGTPETILNGYRAAQILAWRAWMHVAFGLTTDKTELEMLLDFSSKHINAFSQSCVELLAKMIEEERIEHASRSPDRQYEAAKAILSGAVREPQKARQALGYALDRTHQAMIVWSSEPEVNASDLESLLDWIELTAPDAHVLRITAKASIAWVWLPHPVSLGKLRALDTSGFKIALGRVLEGISGFVESHQSALIAQKMMAQTTRQDRVVSYDQVKLAHMMLKQSEFPRLAIGTLGKLLEAPESIRDSLRAYLAEGANAAQAAKALGLHRNTLNRHLERANDLLPEPLNLKNRLQVGAVLDALYWS